MAGVMPSKMEVAGAGRFPQGTKETGLERFYYRKLFCKNEVVECSVLKEQEFTAGEMLRQKAVRD